MYKCIIYLFIFIWNVYCIDFDADINTADASFEATGVPYVTQLPRRFHFNGIGTTVFGNFFTHNSSTVTTKKQNARIRNAVRQAAQEGYNAVQELFDKKEKQIYASGQILDKNSPGAQLAAFSAPVEGYDNNTKLAYGALYTAKKLKSTLNLDFSGFGRQAPPRISLRRTALEGFCPPREPPICPFVTKKYRTHDGTCNNEKHLRWGAAQMPFHRFLPPDYSDGIETFRTSFSGGTLPSARFVSLVVHGDQTDDSQVTLMLPQWGQFIDHDLTATRQPKSINGSIPSCCQANELHPDCMPIKVPTDDPWLSPLGVRCLEFLRSAPASRSDCLLSWREQTNQASSYLDASTVYSSNPRSADNSRIFRDGLLVFGRGAITEDICRQGGIGDRCIRAGDTRNGEQPGLLAMHTVFVAEHNRIALQLSDMNVHWSDEKIYQEARRIIASMVQHITYREFLPLVLGREVVKLFDLELRPNEYYKNYDPKVNPGISNSFAAAAFRFGHSMVQSTIMRSDRNHIFLRNNVSLHNEAEFGDMESSGSLHRLLRGLAMQRAQRRDEFISAELTNHLFQSPPFPFGLDLAAINIQRGRDHGLPPYVSWREPCGLNKISSWDDIFNVMGPRSAKRLQLAYRDFEDIDLFVGGLAERPVSGGLVGPTFACIIAQQFSNLRRGDRFWYENGGFESSFTPAQLQSVKQTSLAQVLCRTLEDGGLQPHVFLPAGIGRNERKPCGVDELAPIDLTPWKEQDPFTKQQTVINNDGQTIAESPFSLSSDELSNKLDLVLPPRPIENLIPHNADKKKDHKDMSSKLKLTTTTTQRPVTKTPTLTTSQRPLISDKIDFTSTTKVTTTTARKSTTKEINKKSRRTTIKRTRRKAKRTKRRTKNKSTTTTTTVPTTEPTTVKWTVQKEESQTRPTLTDRRTTVRAWIVLENRRMDKKLRHTRDVTKNLEDSTFSNQTPLNLNNKPSDALKINDLVDFENNKSGRQLYGDSSWFRRPFFNQDNATAYLRNHAVSLGSLNPKYRTNDNYDNEFDYDYYRPPVKRRQEPPKSKRPIGFRNNVPIFDISDEESEFDLPSYGIPSTTTVKTQTFSSVSYDIEIPLYIAKPTNRVKYRPNNHYHTTTSRPELHTFYSVDDDLVNEEKPFFHDTYSYRPPLTHHKTPGTTAKPYFQSRPVTVDPLTFFMSSSPSLSSLYSSDSNNEPPKVQSTFISSIGNNSPGKKDDVLHVPSYLLPEVDEKYFISDKDWEKLISNDVKTTQKYKPSYTDYSQYNQKTKNAVKYYYVDNILHKIDAFGEIYRKKGRYAYAFTDENNDATWIRLGRQDNGKNKNVNNNKNIDTPQLTDQTDKIIKQDAQPEITMIKSSFEDNTDKSLMQINANTATNFKQNIKNRDIFDQNYTLHTDTLDKNFKKNEKIDLNTKEFTDSQITVKDIYKELDQLTNISTDQDTNVYVIKNIDRKTDPHFDLDKNKKHDLRTIDRIDKPTEHTIDIDADSDVDIDSDIDKTGKSLKKLKKKPGSEVASFVSFVILNSAERPDNWINIEPKNLVNVLPDMPLLPDESPIATEFPSPIKFKFKERL